MLNSSNSRYLLFLLLSPLEPVPYLANPEDARRADDDDDPIKELQTDDIEELLQTRYLDHGNLSGEYYRGDGKQSLTALEVECAAVGLERTGTEQIEEVGHDEDGEEQCQLVRCQSVGSSEADMQQVGEPGDVRMLEDVQQDEQQEEEEASYSNNILAHVLVEDECLAVARLVLHDTL